MSRITGTDALGLVEAYNAVYTPQELTEEQVWEEVEGWVNSLLEEGYDLSEYTWDELYEEYVEEQGRSSGSRASQTNQSVSLAPIGNAFRSAGAAAQRVGSFIDRTARSGDAAINRAVQRVGSSIGQSLSAANRVPTSSGSRNVRGGGTRPAARPQIGSLPSSARQVTQYPQGVSTGVGGGNAGASRTAPGASRPAPRPAPRPAATPSTAAPRPAATPSATAPGPAATPSATAPGPAATPSTRPSISSQLSDIRAMRARSLERQGKPSTQMSHADLYDIVKGHLLDEGYADTEEAAIRIMSSMSEEWKESILSNLNEEQKPLPTQKMKNRRFRVHMKTGEAAGSPRNEKIAAVLDAHKKDPEGEAAKAKAKSKYKG